MGRRVRSVPAPLAAVLAVAAVLAIGWSVLLPAYEGPDEISHFAYAQRLAETGSLTWSTVSGLSDADAPAYSTEVGSSDIWAGTAATHGNVAMQPYTTALDERLWESASADFGDAQRSDGGFTSAMRNPPLYYLATAPVYLAGESADVFTRLHLVRLLSVPFLLAVVVFTWLLAGELLGRRRVLQTLAAGSVALIPQLALLGGVVNPDAMLAAIWSAALYLMVLALKRGGTRGRLIGLVLLTIASALTHGRGVPLAVPVGLTFAILAWRRWVPEERRTPRLGGGLLAGALVAFLAAASWFAVRGDVSAVRLREWGSYLWQFYLPRPGFLTENAGSLYDARRVYIDRFFSELAQFDIALPGRAVDTLSWVVLAGLVLLVVVLVVRRDAVRRQAAVAVVLASAMLAVVVTLHAVAWRDLLVATDPVITGRYLTPLAPLFGIAIALLVRELPRPVRPGAGTAVLGVGVVMNLCLFATAVVRFHV